MRANRTVELRKDPTRQEQERVVLVGRLVLRREMASFQDRATIRIHRLVGFGRDRRASVQVVSVRLDVRESGGEDPVRVQAFAAVGELLVARPLHAAAAGEFCRCRSSASLLTLGTRKETYCRSSCRNSRPGGPVRSKFSVDSERLKDASPYL
jgi:hypothetical protein